MNFSNTRTGEILIEKLNLSAFNSKFSDVNIVSCS
jgi:hypothetical protein